ncbi:Nitrite reductase [NAD(P)H] small subunit [hydrothermal vent metagenome]|uniref:Nitrite reductase [NAD(P)H] small subunit n=1 Tax=hydrothermal vent metagenome TaxID=652676 RepID=A0A3B1E8Y4_9ZZZZ
MTQFHQVATVAEVSSGSGKEVVVEGKIVALFDVEGEIFAIDGMCAHAGGPLGKGCLEGSIITCPWHGWQYDVVTGKHCLTENIQQETFAVKVEDGKIFVAMTTE